MVERMESKGVRPSVLVFGGTSEGYDMAEWLGTRDTCNVIVSSLTEYGGSLVRGFPNVESLTGRMLPEAMQALMNERDFICVVDATHPYAAGVTASIAEAAAATSTPVVRVLREGEPDGPWQGVDNAEEAARFVAESTGNVLLTTGSKDLSTYVSAMGDYVERLYVRILPVAASLEAADELGIPLSHVIAMKGPFSKELNKALIEEFDIKTLVTKASGVAGGFWEKVEAAQECGIDVVVIHRPTDEDGLDIDQAKAALETEYGL